MTSPTQPENSVPAEPQKTVSAQEWITPEDPEDPQQPGDQLELFIHRSKTFVGPVPPPDLLREYAVIDKGLPDRLISMAEREQAHRHQREDQQLGFAAESGKRAQAFATGIALVAMLCSVPIAIWGNPWAAGVIGFGGVVGHIIPVLIPKTRKEPEPSSAKGEEK